MIVKKNTHFYGKNKHRTEFIKEYVFNNLDKNILIIDIEKDVNKLYPLTQLNQVNRIILNSNIDYILNFLADDNLNLIIINGYQNIEEVDDDSKNIFLLMLEPILKDKEKNIFFLSDEKNENFTNNKKVEKLKIKNIEEKIFEINKELDFSNKDIHMIKSMRTIIIEDKQI